VDKDEALTLALRHVAAEGVRTLSLTALAERAGVSRATVYRMFSGRADLMAQLAAREMQFMVVAGMAELDLTAATAQVAADLVTFALGYLRRHRGLNRVRELEPESLLTFVITHDGAQLNVIELVISYVEPVLADPRHRPQLAMPPRQAAEHLVRLVLSHFLAESRNIDDAALGAVAARTVCRS
jgi:AcrR family transcriptional regulator